MSGARLMTGSRVGILFTYEDGTTAKAGPWTVPHSANHGELHDVGSDLGWYLLYEMAKQPTKTVARAEIVPWPETPDPEDTIIERGTG